MGTFGRLWNGLRSVPACRRNCSSNTKKIEPIFSTHTIFLIKNQITTQRPHNKKFLTILKTMHCKMPQMLMVPLLSDNVHLVLTGVKYFGTLSGANTLRKMVQSATTKSITNEQTKTENRPLKLHSEGGFCLLLNRSYQPVTSTRPASCGVQRVSRKRSRSWCCWDAVQPRPLP